MTLAEYELRMEAYSIKRIERQADLATQAWLSQQVQATTGSSKNPKPKYKRLTEFFDKQAAIDKVRSDFEPDYEISHMSKAELKRSRAEVFAKRLAEFEQLKKQGKIIPLSQRQGGEYGGQ